MPKTANAAKVKASGIRAINRGTRYDVTGSLRKTLRSIESGEYGEVRDAVLVFSQQPDGDISPMVRAFHFGTSSVGEAHLMLDTIKNRLEPA